MSEPDSTPRRRPPTIDLTATEVENEKPARGPETSDGSGAHNARAAPNFAARLRPHLIGGAAGAIVMAAIVIGLWLAGLFSWQNAPPANTNNGDSAISAQLGKIQAELQARPAESALTARLATVEAQAKSLGDSLAAINRRLDDIAVAAKSARDRADAASAAANGAAQNSVQRGDLDALANRIAALEGTIKTLSDDAARRALSADDRAARAAVAAEALRAIVERGAPYKSELGAVKAFGADQNAVAALELFAADGVPTAAALAHELSQLTPSLLKASGAAASADSFLGRLEDSAKNLVRITPVDAPASDEPSAVVARLDADAARADIAAALADIDRLPQAAKTLADPWVQRAHARDAAIAASRHIAADALAGLGNSGTQ
jgi:hypothetical protein